MLYKDCGNMSVDTTTRLHKKMKPRFMMQDTSLEMHFKIKNKVIPHNKPTISAEEIKAAADTLGNLELTVGTKVGEFEKAFSDYIGMNSVATSSGTSALHLTLIAIGIAKNDEVIIPSYTCIAVALPVLYQQAKPILADVSDEYNISVEDVKKKITNKTKAIIVPHMFGYPADLNEIKELCEENNVYLVEDCAQAIGATYQDKKVGTVGDISIFSFYATKMMTTVQGGMVCTNNSEWIQIIKDLRYHDQCRSLDDNDPRVKYSYMMSDVGAVIGVIQLKKLDYFITRRREVASIYREKLDDKVVHPQESNEKKDVYSRYVIRTSFNPSEIIAKMREQNIICERMYVPPLHRRVLVEKFNSNAEFPKTEAILDSAVSLPVYPSLRDEEVEYVADVFNGLVKGA
jgi:perosamine synthetase